MITWLIAGAWGSMASWVAIVPAGLARRWRRSPGNRPPRVGPGLCRWVSRALVAIGVPAGLAGDRDLQVAVGWAAAGGTAGLAVGGAPGLVVAIGPLALWARTRRQRRRAVARAEDESLPEVVDLLALALGAGLTVRLAIDAVGRRAEGPVADALRAAAQAAAGERRLADALERSATGLGARAQPLLGALVASERYGAPLGPTLERLAAESRADLRRRAEERARRVPVLLLFPLVLCVLPAFALLTVTPLLAGALQSLRFG